MIPIGQIFPDLCQSRSQLSPCDFNNPVFFCLYKPPTFSFLKHFFGFTQIAILWAPVKLFVPCNLNTNYCLIVNIHPQRQSACSSCFCCKLLLLYWSPVGVVLRCGGWREYSLILGQISVFQWTYDSSQVFFHKIGLFNLRQEYQRNALSLTKIIHQ